MGSRFCKIDTSSSAAKKLLFHLLLPLQHVCELDTIDDFIANLGSQLARTKDPDFVRGKLFLHTSIY